MLSNFQNYKIFTPGPTPVAEDILRMGSWQPPYNRTQSFSELTLEILEGLKALFNTRGEVVILTASGTGAMEAAARGMSIARRPGADRERGRVGTALGRYLPRQRPAF